MANSKGIESALHHRDEIGVQDFVLLEDYNNVDAFLANLRKRFKANHIYVSLLCCVLSACVCRICCALNSLACFERHFSCSLFV